MSSPLFVSSRAIRHAEVEGCRIILDLRSESYRVLDDVGGKMWSILTGEVARDAALAGLCDKYEVAPARLEADLSAFAARCVEEHLLEPAADARPRPDPAATEPTDATRPVRRLLPGVLAALRSLLATQRAISRDGFRATYERYALIPVRPPGPSLDGAVRAFCRAENFYVVRRAPDDCLVRSLSLYRSLREAGHRAEHVIGVRRFPFQAHAWVECAGEVVLDTRAEHFAPLARMGDAPPPYAHPR